MRAGRMLASLVLLGNTLEVCAAEFNTLAQIAQYPLHTASATALSLNTATLSAQLQAEVVTINARVSQSVARGDVLVSLDCTDYRLAQKLADARVRAAEARRTLANSQRERTEQLLARQLTSPQVSDTVIAESIARTAELDEAQIGQRQAALHVSRCQITAPFDGIITERNAAEGQFAAVGSPLVTMVETARIELAAHIDPADIPLLQNSSEHYFDDGKQLPVTVYHLGGVIDSSSRNQEVRFTFVGEMPLPGTAGKLVWRDPRPFIPPQYLVLRQQRYGIFVARQDVSRSDAAHSHVAEFVPLPSPTPGRANPVDLPLDTLIVTEGLGTLNSGDAL